MLQNIQNIAKLQAQKDKLQKILQSIVVTGTSKNGKVTVKMSGLQKIIDVIIDPALVVFVSDNFFKPASQDANSQKAQDLIAKGQNLLRASLVEAIDDAISKVQGAVYSKMQEEGAIEDIMNILQTAGGAQ